VRGACSGEEVQCPRRIPAKTNVDSEANANGIPGRGEQFQSVAQPAANDTSAMDHFFHDPERTGSELFLGPPFRLRRNPQLQTLYVSGCDRDLDDLIAVLRAFASRQKKLGPIISDRPS
jgi:hypothetical protein